MYVIAWLIRDDRLLISIRNSFFSGSPFGKNFKVKRAQLGVISGWVTDREVMAHVPDWKHRRMCQEGTFLWPDEDVGSSE